MISFEIPGEAVPFARSGGHGKVRFTPKPQRNHAAVIKLAASQAMQGAPPMEGPISVIARFEYLHPDSWSRKKKAATRFKTSKPDADNLVKLIKDGLNTIVWRDDAQVARIEVEKLYGLTARTVVTVSRLEALV